MAWDWEKLQNQKKSGSGGTPLPVEEILNRIKNAKFKFPGVWIIIVLLVVLYAGSSMVYKIDARGGERGIIQRFGKHVRTTTSGIHVKWPGGIEKLTKVRVDFVFKEEFGFRTLQAGVRTRFATGSAYRPESLMLTGDLNVALVPWIVQYKVNNPADYLFKVRNVRSTLRDLTEATMRLVVGDRSINEVISNRVEIADQARMLLQKELDSTETGLNITTIEMKKTNVPEPVQPSFNEVNQAIQEKEKMVYQAREAYNKVLPQARGQAEKTVKAAEGYAMDRVNRAKGDASRFLALYEEYSKAEDVTRRRLYLETIREVFPKLGSKYIVDEGLNNLLPLLNLSQPKGGE